jgi:hypothetical protein
MSDAVPAPLYCANHPRTETSLRCNRCEKPICPQCAVLTPTGYRCRECVRGQQKVFTTASWVDYPLAFISAAVISYLGSLLVNMIGFFTLLLAPLVGIGVAEVVRWVIRRRRGPGLYTAATVGAVLGSLVGVVGPLFLLLYSLAGQAGLANTLQSLLWFGIRALYTVLMTTSMYYRLTGIRLKL